MTLLTGLRVLELAQNAAVPMCGRLLAGLGADVVKVEPPDGDAMRHLGQLAPNESRPFATINPGKRGIAVDLSSPESHEVLDALFAWADVALVGFKQADLKRYRVHWEHARTINPRLVYLAHTAFGPDGPDADLGGYDVLVQARSGVGYIMNRSDGSVPLTTRPAVNDFGSGMVSAFAVMVALRHRDATGEGQRVDTSLLGTALSLGMPLLTRFPSFDDDHVAEVRAELEALQVAGGSFDDQRELYEERSLPNQGVYHLYFRHYATGDGLMSVAALSPALFGRFHDATGVARPQSHSESDPTFLAAIAEAEAVFRGRGTDEWLAILQEAGVPCAKYVAPYEALDDVQARVNGYVAELEHPAFGPYTTVGMPLRFEAASTVLDVRSPMLGEHSAEVLAEIGLSHRIDDLAANGTIRLG